MRLKTQITSILQSECQIYTFPKTYRGKQFLAEHMIKGEPRRFVRLVVRL